MSNATDGVATHPDPRGWRAGGVRVVTNALLALVAFEVVSLVAGAAQMIVTSASPPATPVEGVPFLVVAAGFLLVRWIVVLPGMLPVLVWLELAARRTRHARLLAAFVSFAPMVLWELLSDSPGVISEQGLVLGVTAALFAAMARLPTRSTFDPGADGVERRPGHAIP